MSDIMTIEQLAETSASDLVGSDLLMTSVRNINGSYTSKKMTLSALANYVNSRESGGVTGFGGYEMIDTTEYGTGVYTAETISQYISDRNKNYLWDLKLGAQGVYDVDVPFVKTLGKDCAIWIYGFVKEGTEQGETQVFLNDNVRLYNLECLKQSGIVQFYAKAGQTVKVVQSRGIFCRIFIIPLASGGKYFFDASDPTKFKRGVLAGTGVTPVSNWPTYDNDFIERADGSNHIKVTAPYPMLFAGGFILNDVSGGNTAINEKNTLYAGWNGSSGLTSNYVCLKEGDVFETNIPSNSSGGIYWIAYPLLSDAVRYVQLWENGPYWADRNIGAENQEDFGQFFMPFQTTGYWQKNSGFTGEDGIRGFYFKRESNLPSEFYDVNQSSVDLIFQKLIDSGYAEVYETDSSNRDVAKIKQQHDPAHVKLGNGWRLPTKEDFQQLIDNCNQSYDAVNGVYGIRFTSNADSSKSIFFPACGHAVGETSPLSSTGSSLPKDVQYLSSTITKYALGGTSNYKYADINIMNGSVGFASNGTPQISQATARSWQDADQWGWPIRPVKD